MRRYCRCRWRRAATGPRGSPPLPDIDSSFQRSQWAAGPGPRCLGGAVAYGADLRSYASGTRGASLRCPLNPTRRGGQQVNFDPPSKGPSTRKIGSASARFPYGCFAVTLIRSTPQHSNCSPYSGNLRGVRRTGQPLGGWLSPLPRSPLTRNARPGRGEGHRAGTTGHRARRRVPGRQGGPVWRASTPARPLCRRSRAARRRIRRRSGRVRAG